MFQLSDTDTKELWFLRDFIASEHFPLMQKSTQKLAIEAMVNFWLLIEVKYKVDIMKIKVVTRAGELLL